MGNAKRIKGRRRRTWKASGFFQIPVVSIVIHETTYSGMCLLYYIGMMLEVFSIH